MILPITDRLIMKMENRQLIKRRNPICRISLWERLGDLFFSFLRVKRLWKYIGNGLVMIVAFGCIFFSLKFPCYSTNISEIHRVERALLCDALCLIQSGRLRNDLLCLAVEVPVWFMQKSVSLFGRCLAHKADSCLVLP